jgi:iduronate 2-sulfatase
MKYLTNYKFMPISALKTILFSLLLSTLIITTSASERKNILLICVDDLRPELNCYGVDYIHSPNIDRLAASGRAFHNHYVNAPTCGASRYSLLTGDYYPEAKNHALFDRAKQIKDGDRLVRPSLPAWFRQHGYTTTAIGKISHHPGGLGGKNWDNPSQVEMPDSWDKNLQPIGEWKHPRGVMHALAEGKIRTATNKLDVFEAFDGKDHSYPDGLITASTIEEIKTLEASEKPFFLAVGFIRPHLPFGAPKKYLDYYKDCELPAIPHPNKPKHPSTWQSSGEFMKYNRWSRNPISDPDFADKVRRHYAACVSYVDAQIGKVIDQIVRSGLRENTIVILWGDHGWHLGEYGVWGKHTLFEESLRSPLIISYANIDNPGEASKAVVETVDIFPTICDLAKIPIPKDREGTNLKSQLKDPECLGHSALAFQRNRITIRTKEYRLIVHKGGFVELYNFSDISGVSVNQAKEKPEVVHALTKQLKKRYNWVH